MRVVALGAAALVPSLLIFSIVASVAFCWGTDHLSMYRYPIVTWWQYLPYHGYRRDWDDWLGYGAILGAVASVPVFARLCWEVGAKRFFFRLCDRRRRAEG